MDDGNEKGGSKIKKEGWVCSERPCLFSISNNSSLYYCYNVFTYIVRANEYPACIVNPWYPFVLRVRTIDRAALYFFYLLPALKINSTRDRLSRDTHDSQQCNCGATSERVRSQNEIPLLQRKTLRIYNNLDWKMPRVSLISTNIRSLNEYLKDHWDCNNWRVSIVNKHMIEDEYDSVMVIGISIFQPEESEMNVHDTNKSWIWQIPNTIMIVCKYILS